MLRGFWARIPEEVRCAFVFFLVTRAILLIIGLLTRSFLPTPFVHEQYISYTGVTALDLWGVWDAWWYETIAHYGYVDIVPFKPHGNYAFFPLYPLLMRAGALFTGSTYLAGLFISNMALILLGVFLYRLARKDLSHTQSIGVVTALFLFPTAFMFSGVLTESLFMLVVILAFLFAREKNWLLAGTFGMLAAVTRQPGAIIFIPLLIEAWRAKELRRSFPLLLVPFGLGVVMLSQYLAIGDPLGFMHLQVYWRPMSPVNLFVPFGLNAPHVFSILCTMTAFALLCWNARSIRTSYFVFSILALLVPLLTGSFMSMPRFILQAFPLFFIFGKGLRGKNGLLVAVVLSLLQGFLMVFWVSQSYLVV